MGARVLVVEDDPALRETLVAILVEEGYLVDQAPHGAAALARVSVQMPDVIVLDLMLPIMDGATFVRELCRRGLRASLSILVLTADARMEVKVRQIGVEAALAKPFDLDLLLNEIARLAPA